MAIGVALGISVAASAADAGIKVLTLNVKGKKASTAFVQAVLNQRLPDIACLTESSDHPENFITVTNGLSYYKQNSSYVAILSKTPLTPLYDGTNGNPAPVPPNGDFIDYKAPFPPAWPNNAGMGNRSVGARTTLATGEQVYVVCAHLDSNNYFTKPLMERNPVPGASGAYRDGQISAILTTIGNLYGSSGRALILGDFNAASHLDWSWWISPYPPAGSGGRTDDGGADWAVSRILLGAPYNYTDVAKSSFLQVVTPNGLAEPLPTWPYPNGTDSYTPPGYKHERIDQIYMRGFGSSSGYKTLNTETTGLSPWSTDHAGVEVVLVP
jgi:hypothetical protein